MGELLQEATQRKFYAENPFHEIIQYRLAAAKALQEVRQGLVERSLCISAMKQLIVLLTDEPNNPYKLAIFTRVFTGATPKELSVLKVSDFKYDDDAKEYYIDFHGEESIDAEGNFVIGLPKSIECCRKIPLIPPLTEALCLWCDGKDSDAFLFYDYVHNKRISSNAIRKFGRDVLGNVKNGNDPLVLPIDEDEEKTTNRSSYRADFYRSNFAYYMRSKEVDMDEGELNYLLGNKQKRTFDRHYRDFETFFSLKSLAKKLNRWCAAVYFEPLLLPKEIKITGGIIEQAHSNRTECIIRTNPLDEEEYEVEIECLNGISGISFQRKGGTLT